MRERERTITNTVSQKHQLYHVFKLTGVGKIKPYQSYVIKSPNYL
jgi:hypothetical protein